MTVNFDLPDLCNIYRPFGAATPTHSGVPCRVVPRLGSGRGSSSGPIYLVWTHWIDFEDGVDVRDGCTRSLGSDYITYADGDKIVATLDGKVHSFVVVWVERRWTNIPKEGIRAYVLRDTVSW